MNKTAALGPRRQIHWPNVLTVLSVAVLIGAEVFGAAYAGGWAIGNFFALGEYGVIVTQVVFFLLGTTVMAWFVRYAQRVEPFTGRR